MLEPLFTSPETPARLPARKRPQARKRGSGPPASRTFEFVSSGPAGKPPAETRKLIRSYVMRGKNKKRPSENQRFGVSWINHGVESYQGGQLVEHSPDPTESHPSAIVPVGEIVVLTPCLPGPLRPPSDLTLFNFATPLDSRSRYLIFRFFTTIKETMYPAEWCFEFDRTKCCWFRWLLYDTPYLYSVLFMVSAFQDLVDARALNIIGKSETRGVHFSPQTQHLLRQTIQLLQERIQDSDQQVSDTTAAIVTTLAMMADASGDAAACAAHVSGLKKIVKLRGGLRGIENRQIQIKICRVDLGWSIKQGTKPDFFEGNVSWEAFLDRVIRNKTADASQTDSAEVQNIINSWDYKLQNVFSDLRDFSKMANTLIPAHQKLQPELFQEMTLSFQYRLLLLEYSIEEPLKEAIRLGLLAYETTIFLQIPGLKLESPLFSNQLRRFIERIDASEPGLVELKLWLVFVGAIIVFNCRESWLVQCAKELMKGQTWKEVRQRLKGVMWINIVHDGPGKQAFDTFQQDQPLFDASGSLPLTFTIPSPLTPNLMCRH